MVSTQTRGTDLETKLFELKHMSRRDLFYLGLTNSILKPGVFERVSPPLSSTSACRTLSAPVLAR
jgi:hypothetical protein